MNDFIVKTYERTADAVVVSKYFGSYLSDKWGQFVVKGREYELLELALEMEAEDKAKK